MVGVIPAVPRKEIVAKREQINENKPLRIPLKRSGYYESIIMRFHLAVSTGTTAPTYKEDDIYRFIRRIRVDVDGTTIKDLYGVDLKHLSLYNYGDYPTQKGSLPTGTDESATVDITVKLPISLCDTASAEDDLISLFPAHEIGAWALTIDFAGASDVVASGDFSIDTANSYVTVMAEYYDKEDLPSDIVEDLIVPVEVTREQDINQTGDKEMDFEDGTIYRRIYLRVVNNDARSDDLVDEYAFVVGKETVKEDDFLASKMQDKLEYGLTSTSTGVTLIDFGTFDLSQSLEVPNDTPVKLKYHVASTPTAPAKLVAVAQKLIPFENFVKKL